MASVDDIHAATLQQRAAFLRERVHGCVSRAQRVLQTEGALCACAQWPRPTGTDGAYGALHALALAMRHASFDEQIVGGVRRAHDLSVASRHGRDGRCGRDAGQAQQAQPDNCGLACNAREAGGMSTRTKLVRSVFLETGPEQSATVGSAREGRTELDCAACSTCWVGRRSAAPPPQATGTAAGSGPAATPRIYRVQIPLAPSSAAVD